MVERGVPHRREAAATAGFARGVAATAGSLDQLVSVGSASTFGISAREAEVMELFADGRSAHWVADELVILKTRSAAVCVRYIPSSTSTPVMILDILKTVS